MHIIKQAITTGLLLNAVSAESSYQMPLESPEAKLRFMSLVQQHLNNISNDRQLMIKHFFFQLHT
jgi:hypothetical protein